jgi:serine/threonine protein kinase
MQFEILNKLRHHYIVRYFDSFIEEHELVIIMEYCGCKFSLLRKGFVMAYRSAEEESQVLQ